MKKVNKLGIKMRVGDGSLKDLEKELEEEKGQRNIVM